VVLLNFGTSLEVSTYRDIRGGLADVVASGANGGSSGHGGECIPRLYSSTLCFRSFRRCKLNLANLTTDSQTFLRRHDTWCERVTSFPC
jgi:hypothetical protein